MYVCFFLLFRSYLLSCISVVVVVVVTIALVLFSRSTSRRTDGVAASPCSLSEPVAVVDSSRRRRSGAKR